MLATEDRSLHTNQIRALRRLRLRLAETVRSQLPDPLPPEFLRHRTADGRIAINERNPDYPIVLAVALDALAGAPSPQAAADRLQLTPTQLQKLTASVRHRLPAASDSGMLGTDSSGG